MRIAILILVTLALLPLVASTASATGCGPAPTVGAKCDIAGKTTGASWHYDGYDWQGNPGYTTCVWVNADPWGGECQSTRVLLHEP